MVLYKEIRRGCKEYHNKPHAYDESYNAYMCISKVKYDWLHPDPLNSEDAADNLLAFLKKWRAWRRGAKVELEDFHSDMQTALQNVAEQLTPLMGKTILDLNLSKTPTRDNKILVGGDLLKIILIFDELADRCGYGGYSSTAASKILHAINPDGFVMWDRNIREEYAQKLLERKTALTTGWDYAYHFLPEMQRIANTAIEQAMNEEDHCSRAAAIKLLTPCGNSLAKVIDEYNYVNSR